MVGWMDRWMETLMSCRDREVDEQMGTEGFVRTWIGHGWVVEGIIGRCRIMNVSGGDGIDK